MAEFSMGDIRPLYGNYFNQPNLTSGESEQLRNTYGSQIDEENMKTLKFAAAIDDKRDRDLRYQMNLETLEARREEATRKRNNDARLGELGEALGSLVDGEGSNEEVTQSLNKFRLSNPESFSDPNAVGLFTAASGILKERAALQAKEDAKTQRELDRIRSAVEAGNEQVAYSRASEGGITAEEQSLLDEIPSFKKQQEDLIRKQSVIELQGANRKSRKKTLEGTRKILNSLSDPRAESGLYLTQDEDGNYVGQGQEDVEEGQLFGNKGRRQLELQLAELTGVLTKDIKNKYSDQELYDEVEKQWRQSQQAFEQEEYESTTGQPYPNRAPATGIQSQIRN